MTGLLNRVKCFTASTGTGNTTVGSAYSTKHMTPAEAGAVDGASYVWLYEQDNDFELIRATYTASGTLVNRSAGTVLWSKIGGSVSNSTKITLNGMATVSIVAAAEDYVLASNFGSELAKLNLTSTDANALTVGRNGTTNPGLQVDVSTASSATGLKIKSAAAAAGVALSVLSSGTNENLTIDAKGSGTLLLQGTATGQVKFGATAVPNVSDGAALGTLTQMWSDLFLANGGLIVFNNAYAITHSIGNLTFNGGITVNAVSNFTSTAAASSPINGAVVIAGGMGVGEKVHANGVYTHCIAGAIAQGFQISETVNGRGRALYIPNTSDDSMGFYGLTGSHNIASLDSTGAWINASDRRWKDEIEDLRYGVDTLMSLTARQFVMRSNGQRAIGFIAQEVMPLIPELVHGLPHPEGGETYFNLNYGALSAVLVNGFQNHERRLAALEQRHAT